MQKLTYLVISTVVISGYMAQQVAGALNYIPEVLSGVVLLVVMGRIAVTRSFAVSPKYVVLGIIAGVHILSGIFVNGVAPGTIIFGLRPYLKWVPVFLIPAVFHYSQEEFSRILRLILGIALLQCPLTLFQRFIQYRHDATGDVITGTLGSGASGALSIFLLSTIAFVVAFYVKGMVPVRRAIVLLVMLFVPTTINETKVTLVLLPLALVVPYLFALRTIKPAQLLAIPAIAMIFTAGFVAIYDQMAGTFGGSGISKFVETEAETYMFRGDELTKGNPLKENTLGGNLQLPRDVIGIEEGGGRFDKIKLPFDVLSNESVKLWTGLGVGNVMLSSVKMFSGSYGWRLGEISNDTLLSLLLWDTGIGGVLLFVMFLIFLFIDTYRLVKQDDFRSAIAAGSLGVLVIVLMSIAYTNLFYFNTLIFLFALLSGWIAAESRRVRDVR